MHREGSLDTLNHLNLRKFTTTVQDELHDSRTFIFRQSQGVNNATAQGASEWPEAEVENVTGGQNPAKC